MDQAYGGWVVVEARDPTVWPIEGELLAADTDSVYVLEPRGFRATSWGSVARAQVTGYDSGAGEVAGMAALGAFSALTHGYLIILTAPLWGVVGSSAANFQARYPVRSYPDKHDIEELTTFARFPGGLPAGLDRASLKLVSPDKERVDRKTPRHSLFGDP